MKLWVLVVAAGRSRRFGGDIPKQYVSLSGKPLLRHSVDTLTAHPSVSNVSVVIDAQDQEIYLQAMVGAIGITAPIIGNNERQSSIRNGLEFIASNPWNESIPDFVLIHDAARPLVSNTLIDRLMGALVAGQGVAPILPVSDSLKHSKDGYNFESVSRSGMWRSQTPQIFSFTEILSAHRRFSDMAMTDDYAVAEAAGMTITTVRGDELNIKINDINDLNAAQRILGTNTYRESHHETLVGFGFDAHRLGPGTGITLCGITIPYERTLIGHSDSDVALHALTDAVLGALGEGDIGLHFPSSDARWLNAESEKFLAFAIELMIKRGGCISNVDVTLICEKPRLSPHRRAMIEKVAAILALNTDRVSIKATTTDQLGFTGRGEGIAAQAVVTLRLPARGRTSFE